MTLAEAQARAARVRARIVEVIYVNGAVRVNVVLPNGKPRTWKCER
jgi:hypothetical protein